MNSKPLFRIRIIISTLLMLVMGGTALFHWLEDYTLIQSFYFSVTTMTTVGYGDVVPTNDTTRLVVSIYILIAVSLYVSLITHFGAHYLELREMSVLKREEKKKLKKEKTKK